MMPNGGHSNMSWGPPWFPSTAVSLEPNQIQGIADVNAFHMIAAQQLSHQYGAAAVPWNDAQVPWVQWQSNVQPANWTNNFAVNTQPPLPPQNPSVDPPPPPPPQETSSYSHLSEEEKNFDIQFKEWEEKFQIWKEENKNHPDKKSLAVYQAQWTSWREQLIQNREKLRKKREEASKHHHGSNQPALCQATQALKNSDNQNVLHQPQALNVSSPFYTNPALQTNTQVNEAGNSSKGPMQMQHHFESGYDRQMGIQSSPNFPHPQFDHSSRKFHEDFRVQQIQHSDVQPYHTNEQTFRPRFEQGQKELDSQLCGSKQHNPRLEFHDLRQRHTEFSGYSNDRSQQSMIPVNQQNSNIPPTINPPLNGPNFPIPQGYSDGELRSPPSSSETAASLFRKRAMRGKVEENRFAPYSAAPEVQLDRRSRIEERLAECADIKLSILPQPRLKEEPVIAPLSREHEKPNVKPLIMEPIVFEYNHRPGFGRYGRFATAPEPICIDYSHGKSRTDESLVESQNKRISQKTELQTTPKPQEIMPIKPVIPKKEPVIKIPIKPTPPPLFPSAAAIQVNKNQFHKVKLEIPPASAVAVEKMPELVLPQIKVEDHPKMDVIAPVETEIVMVEDLLLPPGRYGRPSKIVVILRGLPGSGKSHFARLIKEKEITIGGSAPRILSIDDYYLMDDGCSPVSWQEDQEEQYRQSLLKSLKRNLDDGHFSFIIVDALHIKVKEILDIHSTAQSRAFAVYLVDLPDNPHAGTTRKCTEKDMEKMKSDWQKAPDDIPRLDIRWFLQETVETRFPTPDNAVTSTTVWEAVPSTGMSLADDGMLWDSQEILNEVPTVSKWEMMEQTEEKLDRLDGIVKRKLDKPTSMEDWLQFGLPDDYDQRKCVEGKKRVRWADVEEQLQQKKMRDLGFVVGQTDWSRMTDPTRGESALTKTKYI